MMATAMDTTLFREMFVGIDIFGLNWMMFIILLVFIMVIVTRVPQRWSILALPIMTVLISLKIPFANEAMLIALVSIGALAFLLRTISPSMIRTTFKAFAKPEATRLTEDLKMKGTKFMLGDSTTSKFAKAISGYGQEKKIEQMQKARGIFKAEKPLGMNTENLTDQQIALKLQSGGYDLKDREKIFDILASRTGIAKKELMSKLEKFTSANQYKEGRKATEQLEKTKASSMLAGRDVGYVNDKLKELSSRLTYMKRDKGHLQTKLISGEAGFNAKRVRSALQKLNKQIVELEFEHDIIQKNYFDSLNKQRDIWSDK